MYSKQQQVRNLALISLVLIAISPTLIAFLYFNLGNIHVLKSTLNNIDSEHLTLAQGLFDRAEQYAPSLSRVHYWRGQAYFLAGQQQNALDAWRVFPDADYWLTMRGKYLLRQGQVEPAIDILRTALAVNPASSTICYYGGLALYRAEQYDKALEWHSKALELEQFDERFMDSSPRGDVWWPARPDNLTHDPTPAMTYIQISAVYYQLKQWDMMQAAAQAAIDLAPDDPLGYFQLGWAYFRWANADSSDLEDKAEFYRLAEKSLVTVVDQIPDHQYPFFLVLARVYAERENIPAATVAYQRVLNVSGRVGYQYEVARFYAATGQAQAALPLYEAILSRTPHEAEFGQRWIDAAEAYFVTSKQDVACTLFKEGVDICGETGCNVQDSILWSVCPVR